MTSWVELSEVVRNLGSIILPIAALIGLFLAWKRVNAANIQAEAALNQAEMSRRTHVAELFNRAVTQLGNDRFEVRLAAIYTLRQIGTDFRDLAQPTLDLLSVYLRENAAKYGDDDPPLDVREIIETVRGLLEET